MKPGRFGRRGRFVLAALAACPAVVVPARAQPGVATEGGVASAYLWRGLTVVNRPVVQGSLVATLPARGGTLEAGAWGNLEPLPYDGPNSLSAVAGTGPDLTEVDLWAEYRRPAGRVQLSLGVLALLFPNDAGTTSAANTAEVYGRVTAAGPVSWTVTAYHDVARVRGSYVEATLARDVAVPGGRALVLSAGGGASFGEAADPASRDLAYYANDGVTHAQLSAALPLRLWRLTATPVLTLVVPHDGATRTTAPGATGRAKVVFGASVRGSRSPGSPPSADP